MSYPYGFQKVKVGQEVTLCAVQPVSRRLTDDFLRHLRDVAIADAYKLLQRRGVAQISQVHAEAFNQHLRKQFKSLL